MVFSPMRPRLFKSTFSTNTTQQQTNTASIPSVTIPAANVLTVYQCDWQPDGSVEWDPIGTSNLSAIDWSASGGTIVLTHGWDAGFDPNPYDPNNNAPNSYITKFAQDFRKRQIEFIKPINILAVDLER